MKSPTFANQKKIWRGVDQRQKFNKGESEDVPSVRRRVSRNIRVGIGQDVSMNDIDDDDDDDDDEGGNSKMDFRTPS